MMKSKKIVGVVAFGLLALLSCAQEARAAYVYTYTGNTFTWTTGIYNGGVQRLIFEFTISTPLPPNLPLGTPLHSEVSSMKITAGPEVVDVIAAYLSGATIQGFDPILGVPHGWFATDGSGNITQWNLGVNVIQSGYERHYYSNNSALWIVMDLASQGLTTEKWWNGYTPFSNNEARVFYSPGTWTVTMSPEVPEPRTALLILGPLCLMAILRRRRTQGRT
jgi:hypothetical protein